MLGTATRRIRSRQLCRTRPRRRSSGSVLTRSPGSASKSRPLRRERTARQSCDNSCSGTSASPGPRWCAARAGASPDYPARPATGPSRRHNVLMSDAVPSSPGVSARMSRQASRDTASEIAVRKLLHADGLRIPGERRGPRPASPDHRHRLRRGKGRDLPGRVLLAWLPAARHTPEGECGVVARETGPQHGSRQRDHGTSWPHLVGPCSRFWEHESPAEIVARVEATVSGLRSEQGGTRRGNKGEGE